MFTGKLAFADTLSNSIGPKSYVISFMGLFTIGSEKDGKSRTQ